MFMMLTFRRCRMMQAYHALFVTRDTTTLRVSTLSCQALCDSESFSSVPWRTFFSYIYLYIVAYVWKSTYSKNSDAKERKKYPVWNILFIKISLIIVFYYGFFRRRWRGRAGSFWEGRRMSGSYGELTIDIDILRDRYINTTANGAHCMCDLFYLFSCRVCVIMWLHKSRALFLYELLL